jgi:hypothetical protein
MSEIRVPTEADWRSEPWGIDTPWAYRHFFGKSSAEAFDLFVENALFYQEDIMFMPLACFNYYVHAYMDYLLSDKSAGDADGASCFFGIVEVRCHDICAGGESLRRRVREVLDRLRNGERWYDAQPEIDGQFSARADEATRLIENCASG